MHLLHARERLLWMHYVLPSAHTQQIGVHELPVIVT